jgi:hypothetical protein
MEVWISRSGDRPRTTPQCANRAPNCQIGITSYPGRAGDSIQTHPFPSFRSARFG